MVTDCQNPLPSWTTQRAEIVGASRVVICAGSGSGALSTSSPGKDACTGHLAGFFLDNLDIFQKKPPTTPPTHPRLCRVSWSSGSGTTSRCLQ